MALVAAIAIVFLLFICTKIMREAVVDEEHPADAIVVFGAAEYVGHPSPVYRARLDHAYTLFKPRTSPRRYYHRRRGRRSSIQ